MPPVKVRPLLRGASRNHAMWQNGPRTCPLRPGFVVATDPKCQFGGEDSMIVNATVRSANLMQCWSPINDEKDGGIPWSRSYDVYSRAVEVSLNGVDWTTSNRAFTYYGSRLILA
jgi:hypothetical protein